MFNFFPKLKNYNNKYLVIEYLTNDKDKPGKTNLDFLKSVVKIHSVSNKLFGFDFNTQMGALEQLNNFEESWVKFYLNNRLIPIFELANKKDNMGIFINEKINYIFKNIQNFIPNNPKPSNENITSINKELENKIPINADGKPAITISIAFLKTCP